MTDPVARHRLKGQPTNQLRNLYLSATTLSASAVIADDLQKQLVEVQRACWTELGDREISDWRNSPAQDEGVKHEPVP